MSVSRRLPYQTAERGTNLHRATPAGGASSEGRGCIWFAPLLVGAIGFGGTVQAEDLPQLPSGQVVQAIEYFADDDGFGPLLRARYHAEWLSGDDDIEMLLSDMTHLCETDAVSVLASDMPGVARVMVSLSGRALDFGEIAPDVPQYFEVYQVENGRCIWELY